MIDFLLTEIAPWVAILILLFLEWTTHVRVNRIAKMLDRRNFEQQVERELGGTHVD